MRWVLALAVLMLCQCSSNRYYWKGMTASEIRPIVDTMKPHLARVEDFFHRKDALARVIFRGFDIVELMLQSGYGTQGFIHSDESRELLAAADCSAEDIQELKKLLDACGCVAAYHHEARVYAEIDLSSFTLQCRLNDSLWMSFERDHWRGDINNEYVMDDRPRIDGWVVEVSRYRPFP